jgi:CheY-like chemotaxis protein
MGRVGLALMGLPDGALKNHLLSVEKAVTRAVSLTKQLLTFSKGGKPEKCIISLKRIIQETAKFSLSGSSVDVQFDFKDTHNVEADSGQIAQVIQNLVINAKQAMPMGGVIKISTSNEIVDSKIYIKIRVCDSGIGISKDYISRIFDPYFTTKESGSGLGLSVCYSIINKHDGILSVQSEPGTGTTFEILLPASLKSEDLPNVEIILEKKSNYRILVMDDDTEIRDLVSEMLEAMDHEVVLTKEGAECLKVFSESLKNGKKFDLILMDLTVKGGMGGLETTQKIKELDPDVKVIISSGYSDKNIIDFSDSGFKAKLNKPFSVSDLNRVISEVMG